MSIKDSYNKHKAQLKAINPKYDVVYSVSDKEPIVFEDSSAVRLSAAVIADTHLPNRPAAEANLENAFKDIANSPEKFDAFLMAGDIADYGLKSEYKRFFRALDKFKDDIEIIVTLGNHDARFFFDTNSKIVMNKVDEYLGIKTGGKTYYSYDVKGYTFIVMCTEQRILEKAIISKEQMDFIDSELARGTKDGKPVFVMCHQPFAFTHGLPEVWKTGDLGEQNDEVRAIFEKYKNVFFINGHLHGGIYENVPAVINAENNVHSISVPGYRKPNNFGITDCGTGYYFEVYDDRIVFKSRVFIKGENIKQESEFNRLEYKFI